MGRNTPAARRSIQQRLLHRPPGSRAISDAMCCAVSELGKLMSRFSGNFALPRRWDFVSEASSSTSSTTRTSVVPTTLWAIHSLANRRRRLPAVWGPVALMEVLTLSIRLVARARSSWHLNLSSEQRTSDIHVEKVGWTPRAILLQARIMRKLL